MSKLGKAILSLVEETAWALLFRDGLVIISKANVFKAAAEAGASFLEAMDYCNKLGVAVLD